MSTVKKTLPAVLLLLSACQGTPEMDGSISVRGTYAAPPGPDWGWRIVLGPHDGAALHLQMYNISPDGTEEVAVHAEYTRQSQHFMNCFTCLVKFIATNCNR